VEPVTAETRLRVLIETSRAFSAVVTNHEQLVETIARSTADLVGDGCQVTLIANDGETLFNAASAHRDPQLEADYRAYLASVGVSKTTSRSVSASVARTGEPELVAEVQPSVMLAQTDESLRPIVERLNVHSFVVVPVRGRGQVLGTLSLLRSRPGHAYTSDDLGLLLDLADRAGLAIENARLYDDLERRVRERTAELEALNRELETFSHSVAHELRGPVRRIDGFTRAMVEDYGDRLEPGARKYVASVQRSARHMREVIDALLELSRVSRGSLSRQAVDLSEIAHATIASLRETHPGRNAEILIEPGLIVDADQRLMTVLLLNLLGNAWKFTGRREHSRIELGRLGDQSPPVFFVRDNGAGFDPRHADKLFGAFQRLHTAAEFEGTGVGLATVQRIIRRHAGRIWAESEVNRGATFYFTLAPAQ
jgi:signal transduction histidine kinase